MVRWKMTSRLGDHRLVPSVAWQWSQILQRAVPGLDKRICLKAARRILRCGPAVIFDSKRAMKRGTGRVGTGAYAQEMQRVLRAAEAAGVGCLHVSCHKFFQSLRGPYEALYARPVSPFAVAA